jgi:hypothetical protein
MRRALIVTSLALAGTLIGAGASAAPPVVIRPSSAITSFPLPAGSACDFDAQFDATAGKGGLVLFADGRALTTSPGLKVTVTNLETGAAWSSNASGAFHDQPPVIVDEQLQITSHMTGHNLLFGLFETEAGLEPGMYKFVGTLDVTITLGEAGPIFSDIDDRAARVTDVCAALS